MTKKPPTAHPSPKGFISVRDAWLQTVAAVYPEEWDSTYNSKTAKSSRKHYNQIADKLELALQEGRLQGVTNDKDKISIPADWWPSKAHVTGGQIIKNGTTISIRESDFKRWQRDELGIDVSITGRPKGSGINDELLIKGMHKIVRNGKTPHAAAVDIATSIESDADKMEVVKDRIFRKFQKGKKR